MQAKPATLTALRTASNRTWFAHDTAEILKHVANGSQDVGTIERYSTELVLRLEAALEAAKLLESIARRDYEQKRTAQSEHALTMLEIA